MAAADTDDLDLLAHGAVAVDVARDVVACTGADRVRFLGGIVSGTVVGLAPGAGARSALLTTKGHVLAEMRLFVRGQDVLLVLPAGQGDEIATALSRYAIMDDFAAARRPDMALLAVLGPSAGDRIEAAGVAPGDLASRPIWSHATIGGDWLCRARMLGADGFWIGAPPTRLAAIAAGLGAPKLSPWAAEAARIAAGEPAWGAEITPDYFPMEVGLEDAIDYVKGCYLGQEPIVRIRDRGHLHRRLAGLRFAGGVLPAMKDPIETDAKAKAGHVTSAARLPGGQGVALALVHPDVPDGADVRVRHGDTIVGARVVSAGTPGGSMTHPVTAA